ncbi:hypothetical protein [Actinocatenispora rupis]|uniref:Uncharacterized protein n=1 Tax=Actinocatenispora rupis TaxID=519421 RepID=A0A8J3NFQ7_9ACTN|nr:hypothetical protein [Actinocatenispora rupis]GID14069.1 hypothetical protein Aru02nite_49580 [Actinocatenispora rupis]
MTHLAATAGSAASSALAWLCIAAVVALIVGGYLASCAVWPFANCRKCKGLGRFHAPSGRAWRRCRRCKGTGARLRTGRRVINHFRRLRADANR